MPQLIQRVQQGIPAPLPPRKIERVIMAMRERFEEKFPLSSMAEIAIQSPFHFIRTFHLTTGITPRQFLGAVRLEAAKRLLLTTKRSVTDVCFDVGYNSLGTFTTRFTRLVGLNPRSLRRLARSMEFTLDWFQRAGDGGTRPETRGASIGGQIVAPDTFNGLVFVGAFPTAIPQGSPAACALTRGSSAFTLGPLREGTYYVMATAVAQADDPLHFLLYDNQLRGRAGPLVVVGTQVSGSGVIRLRPPLVTDPPILVALPGLLQKKMARLRTVPEQVSSRSQP